VSPEVPMIARLRRTLAAKDEQIAALQQDVARLEKIAIHCAYAANGHIVLPLPEAEQRMLERLFARAVEADHREIEEIKARRYDLEHPDAGQHEPTPGGIRDPFGTNPGA
jgi:hypothetical protein